MPGDSAVSGGTISHYQVLGLLDREEAATVYRARDGRDDRLVALEVLPAPSDPEALERLRRDAEAAVALGHPHISAALEIGETAEGGIYVARALADGEPLGNRIDRGPMPPEQAVGLASQVAAALGRAHDAGLIHRNLRPANILMTADGQARVAGFGLAWIVEGVGGLAYRSPEQLQGGPVDFRTDVWSLGVILYEMLTGRLPFRGADRDAISQAILERVPVPVAKINPGIPPELDEVVLLALAKPPAERPVMDDLLVILRGVLAGGELAGAEATVVQVPGLRSGYPEPEPVPAAPKSAEGSRPGAGMEQPGDGDGFDGGRWIAHYRIVDTFGGGAMGTVYKAEDTRLKRTVAIKLLPPEMTRDAGSKARFLQEAQAASALDHSNICTIHEVGETEDGELYLAMAAYDGETVKAKIARGPLPVAEAVEIARQTALGLAKAHREGIVHRDIKPANLVVTGDGVVKIVDFGIAKLRGAGGLNVAGSFLGTPSYMSPEQARGEEVDPRADVWSLGVVLYEMLAGTRPFRGGEDLKAVLHSLLKDRPAPLGRLRPEVPPELERIVGGMLAKSPGERYAGASEALADLIAFQGTLAAAVPGRPQPPQHQHYRQRGRSWRGAVAAAALLALTLAYLEYRTYGKRDGAAPVQASFSRLTDQEGRELYPALSPDGGSFVYAKAVAGQVDLFVQTIGGGAPLNLTEDSTVDDSHPAFSPDGASIAFRSERDGGGIYIVSRDGGPARLVSDFGYNPAWSPDGRSLAVATEGITEPSSRKADSEIWRIEVETGRRTLLVREDSVQPSWSPSGERIAYWGLPKDSARRVLWTLPAGGGTPRKVLDDGYLNWNPVWSPDGTHLYFGSDRSGSLNLWRLPIDQSSGEVLGEPQPVTTPAMASGFWSLSSDGGRILYAANESKANLERFSFDPASLRVVGRETAVTRGSHSIRSCDVSPDGRWVAFHAYQPWEDLFVIRPDGSGLKQLTSDRYKDRHPFWSPDGLRLLFYSNRGGNYEAWILPMAGGEPERVLPAGAQPLTFPVWSPDGRQLACTYGEQAAVIDLSEPLQTRKARPLSSANTLGERFYPTSWSLDGERLVGNMAKIDGSMLEGIGAHSLTSGTYLRWTSRGANPVWLHDGRRLLYIEGGRIHLFDTVTLQAREILAPPPSSIYTALSTSPDDRSLFAVRAVDEGDVWLLTLSEEGG